MQTCLRLVLLISSAFALSAHAAEGSGGKSIGVILGFARPSETSTAPLIGLDALYRLSSIGVGLSVQKFGVASELISKNDASKSVRSNASTTMFGPQITYSFGGPVTAGARFGLSKSSKTATATDGKSTVTIDESSSGLFFAPKVGYDQMIAKVSVGSEIEYLYSLSSSGVRGVALLFVTKYWF